MKRIVRQVITVITIEHWLVEERATQPCADQASAGVPPVTVESCLVLIDQNSDRLKAAAPPPVQPQSKRRTRLLKSRLINFQQAEFNQTEVKNGS